MSCVHQPRFGLNVSFQLFVNSRSHGAERRVVRHERLRGVGRTCSSSAAGRRHDVVRREIGRVWRSGLCRQSRQRTAFFAWRRGAQASPRGLESWIRAGERKTCWAKPLFVPPRLWALNAAGSFADASSEHSEQRPEGTDRGSRAFGSSSQPGSDRLARGRGLRWLSQHKRPHSDLAGNSASCGWSGDAGSWCIRNRLADLGPCDAVDHHHGADMAVRTFSQRLSRQRLETVAVVSGSLGRRSGRCHADQLPTAR
jgi:hypothetical protein